MRILFSTIVLDGMPFLPLIWAELRKLPKSITWEWHVIEGVGSALHCTKWVSGIAPRGSLDGTTEFVESVTNFDSRVVHWSKAIWNGKIEMVNTPLQQREIIEEKEPFLLWQMDSDEFWTAEQIRELHGMFTSNCYPEKNAAFFRCRYFVGQDKVIMTRNCFGNHPEYEWHRVWKIKPGMLFRTHEPPVIEGLKLNPFTHAETEARGLVFDHFAYATREQVAFKEKYYAGLLNPNAKHYAGLTDRWEKFQNETVWPRPLKEVMPWVEPHCMVDRI